MGKRSERAIERARRRLDRRLRREARWYWRKRIAPKLARMGFEHWALERDFDGKPIRRHRQTIRFTHCTYNEESIYYEIDTLHLPWRTFVSDLANPDVLFDLSITCRRQVRFHRSIEKGTWLEVCRDESRAGIPALVPYSKVYPVLPKEAPALAFIAGVGQNRSLVWRDLARLPHLLIGGSTDTGKSVMMNQVICTWLQRNTPDTLRLIMIDLKGGVELSFYEGVPHLERDIITQPDEVIPALLKFKAEIDARVNMFTGKCRDIFGWNSQFPAQRLPYFVLVIDELAEIMLDTKEANRKGDAQALLSRCAAVGRAAGCYIIAATQRPETGIITGLTKQNFPARMAFGCASRFDSQTIIYSNDAWGLSPQGRFIWRQGMDMVELQGPLLTTAGVRRVVEAIRAGYVDSEAQKPLDWREVLRYARDNLGGRLVRRDLLAAMRARGFSDPQIRNLIKNIAGQTIGLDGKAFYITPGGRHVATMMTEVPMPGLPGANGDGAASPEMPGAPGNIGNFDDTGQEEDDDDPLVWLDKLEARAGGRGSSYVDTAAYGDDAGDTAVEGDASWAALATEIYPDDTQDWLNTLRQSGNGRDADE